METMQFRGALAAMMVIGATAFAGEARADALRDFQKRAEKYKSVISVPVFETNTNEVWSVVRRTIKDGNAALDRIGKQNPSRVTFASTLGALDELNFQVGLTAN